MLSCPSAGALRGPRGAWLGRLLQRTGGLFLRQSGRWLAAEQADRRGANEQLPCSSFLGIFPASRTGDKVFSPLLS